MSSSVYPVLPGLGWPVKRSPVWETRTNRTASGRRFAVTYWTYPIWRYKLAYEFLRRAPVASELESLAALFNLMRGRWDYFLYSDPDDNAVSALQFGTGDGSTKDFALIRKIGTFAEPIGELNGAPSITIDGSGTSAYTLVDNRIVRFTVAPSNSAVLRWTGSYYMRCVFTADEMDLEKFMAQFWSAKGVEFETLKA